MTRERRDGAPRHILGTAQDIAPTVNEHDHRLFRTRGWIDRIDVERETVFIPYRCTVGVKLRAAVAGRHGVAHACPAFMCGGRAPAQVAHGRRGEGNPAEEAVAPLNRALHLTRLGAHDSRGAHTAGRWGHAAACTSATSATSAAGGEGRK